MMKLLFKISNLCDHGTSTSRTAYSTLHPLGVGKLVPAIAGKV